MLLGGLTGHGSFASDAGVLLEPSEVVDAAAAILHVFIDHGDRTDRKQARLKYLIERWGIDKVIAEAAQHLPFAWRFAALEIGEKRGPVARQGHIGAHAQAQPGLAYIGVVLPAGRVTVPQLRGLAAIAERRGSGTLRLTVWQNLLLSDIPEDEVRNAVAEIEALGLGTAASAVRAGLVACTGNAGCKFALSDTKLHALDIADYLDPRIDLDQPINIHLTGCPNSCAQHYVGDIGLLATKVDLGGDDEGEGYHLLVGGSGADLSLAREIYQSIPAGEVPRRIEMILRAFLARRRTGETFHAFTNRHSVDDLRCLFPPTPWSGPEMGFVAPSLPENAPFSPPQRAWPTALSPASSATSAASLSGRLKPPRRHESRRIFHGMTRGCRSMSGSRSPPEGARTGIDGGDGADRLRAMRLFVQDLRRGDRVRRRDQPQPLRARRQSDLAQAEGVSGRTVHAGGGAAGRTGGSRRHYAAPRPASRGRAPGERFPARLRAA
jgi:dissimilatory sulfite reductase (desulfoviridin) alpha/beta subunit